MVIILMVLVVVVLVQLHNVLYTRFWRDGLSINMHFSSKEAFEGDSLFLVQEVSNKKLLPLPWVLLRYHVSDHLVFDNAPEAAPGVDSHSSLFSVMMYQSVAKRERFLCSKRGFYRIRSTEIVSSNLLHSKRFESKVRIYTDLTVYPKTLNDAKDLALIYKSLDAATLSNSLINPDPFEFKGIREYSPTDPLRNINFKASAVAQQLMVNIYAPSASKRLEIILNVDHYTKYPNYELYEQAIRLAATVASRSIAEDVRVSFFTNGADTYTGAQIKLYGGNSSAHLQTMLEALARVDLFIHSSKMTPQLDLLEDDSVVYLIISPYCGKDFVNALNDMENRGLSYLAVVPVDTQSGKIDHIFNDKIHYWEAI